MLKNEIMNKPCVDCQAISQADSSGLYGCQERRHVAAHLIRHGDVVDAQCDGSEAGLMAAFARARLLAREQCGQTFEVVEQECDGETQIRGQFWQAAPAL